MMFGSGISASPQTTRALATFPSLTHSLFLPLPPPLPPTKGLFFLLLLSFTNYSHQMPPQAKPAPPSPPKLRGRCKRQPSNPDDMNKRSKPNNSDPSDGEHARPSKPTTAGKTSTAARKKVQKKGTKKQCIARLFFLLLLLISILPTGKQLPRGRPRMLQLMLQHPLLI